MKIHTTFIVGVMVVILNSIQKVIGLNFPKFFLWVGIGLILIGLILSNNNKE